MADSDGEYASDDELKRHGKRTADGRSKQTKASWEDVKRSWDTVLETADSGLSIAEIREAEKRRRLLRDTTPLQRGIIRHLMLVLDMSFAMADKDLLPNRYRVVLNNAIGFVREYFEQNPISQLGIVGMRDGIAVRISDLSGNPAEHIEKLMQWSEQQDPQGNPSLQNALQMCRGALYQTPSHATREVLIIYGALVSIDPGDIHDTINDLVADRIRVSVVGLAGQVAICSELCKRTNNHDGNYSVAVDEVHLKELFFAATTPPVTRTPEQNTASLLMMGFPSRTLAPKDHVSFCACHAKPTREGYTCPRCGIKVCRLPIDCPICKLTLIQSTHLARSYHHLFPLKVFVEVPWSQAYKSTACYSCLTPFPARPRDSVAAAPAVLGGRAGAKGSGKQQDGEQKNPKPELKGVSESGRYACQVCGNHFCIDCDVFAHETIHNCPGCQSDTRDLEKNTAVAVPDGGPTPMVMDS
ncbi:Ssl1-like-domain-containing protein [Neurospora crassa]|nr:Ssl1-like-domain-containing protein [Neurospora crassa]